MAGDGGVTPDQLEALHPRPKKALFQQPPFDDEDIDVDGFACEVREAVIRREEGMVDELELLQKLRQLRRVEKGVAVAVAGDPLQPEEFKPGHRRF